MATHAGSPEEVAVCLTTRSGPICDEMVSLCLRHTIPADGPEVVVQEPYLPHVPRGWDGMLVLAEAQNLAKDGGLYVRELLQQSPERRTWRLQDGHSETAIGVAPWDDSHLKLAVEAAFGAEPSAVAVSNAVPWSQVSESGTNRNPEPALAQLAVRFWEQLLPLLRPRHIVTAGKTAREVIARVSHEAWDGRWTKLAPPFSMYLSRLSGLFDQDDLIARFPEVRAVLERRPEYLALPNLRNRVLFACHAVSVTRSSRAPSA